MKISLCLLVFNEIDGCRVDAPRIPYAQFHEVFAVDGGSTDGTAEYLESFGIPVYQQPKKGLNAAYVHAVDKASGEAVVVFFPKGTIDPSSLLQLRPFLEQGYDLVIASRNIPGGKNEEDGRFFKPRKWGVTALAYFIAFLWRYEGHLVKDVLHGYKGFTVSAFRKTAPADSGLSIDIEMVVKAYKHRMRVVEFPVQEIRRHFGITHFAILPTGLKLLRYLWREYWSG